MDTAATQETKPQPKVTALIVSYNNVEALRQCIAALEKSKDREQIEVIVVDKGSRDGSATIDSEFPHITVLRLPRNFGNAKALNIGMRTAAAEYMFFLAPEVEVQSDTVVQLINRLDTDADAVAVCPVLSGNDHQFYRLPAPPHGAELESIQINGDSDVIPVEGATFDAMMARKYFVRGINFLDEKYGHHWVDVDLCYQIRRSGKKVLAIERSICRYTPRPDRFPDNALRLLEADKITGGARYFSKYYGFLGGLLFRIKRALNAFVTFRLGLFSAIISGRKVDGTQTEL